MIIGAHTQFLILRGGGGVLLRIFGGDVRVGSPNPEAFSDQNLPVPFFRPGLENSYPLSNQNCHNLYPVSYQNGSKTIPLSATHNCIADVGVFPPPPPRGWGWYIIEFGLTSCHAEWIVNKDGLKLCSSSKIICIFHHDQTGTVPIHVKEFLQPQSPWSYFFYYYDRRSLPSSLTVLQTYNLRFFYNSVPRSWCMIILM